MWKVYLAMAVVLGIWSVKHWHGVLLALLPLVLLMVAYIVYRIRTRHRRAWERKVAFRELFLAQHQSQLESRVGDAALKRSDKVAELWDGIADAQDHVRRSADKILFYQRVATWAGFRLALEHGLPIRLVMILPERWLNSATADYDQAVLAVPAARLKATRALSAWDRKHWPSFSPDIPMPPAVDFNAASPLL